MKDTRKLVFVIAILFVINIATKWNIAGRIALGVAGLLLLVSAFRKIRRLT